FLRERRNLPRARARVAHVDRDRQGELARGGELPSGRVVRNHGLRVVERAAPGEPERQEAFIRITPPARLLPLEVGEVDRLARRVRLRRAVGEAAADTGFPERA